MANIILWSSVGILVLSLLIGMGVGLIRGVKRSAMHIAFLIVGIVVSFLLTKTITKAILGITIPIDNGKYTVSEYIIYVISKKFDISSFDSASTFVTNLPNAIVAPIMFVLVTLAIYFLFDIAYLITARLVFGKKKEDFKDHSPYRAFGGVIGLFEGLLVVILMFGPISALSGTYKEITTASSYSQTLQQGDMKTVSQHVHDLLPEQVDKAILAWDKSVCGKLPKVFGLNKALFDSLSSFKIEGEKIVLRKEIVNLVYCYDDFVEINNLANRKEYKKIQMRYFKSSIEDVLDGNFFEVVICDSIDKIVTEYETMKPKLPFSPPAILDDIVGEISATFKKKGFDTAQYLKEDINKIVNAFEVVFSNDLINKYNSLANKGDFIEIMKFVNDNNGAVGYVANKLISMNLVEDSFNVFANKAAAEVEKIFEGKEFEVKLNTELKDKALTVQNLLHVVDSVIDLNNHIDIAQLLTTNDIVETLTGVDEIAATMRKMGATFDKLRELELLVIPPKQDGEKPTYVFDNILKNYGIDLLGDEVYLNTTDTEKTVLDSYSKFFNFIAGPIDVAKEIGLTDFGKPDVGFDSILDKILFSLKFSDDHLLTRVVMPFYQLNCMNLKSLVFDKVVENLQTNVNILTLDEVLALDDYHVWAEEFDKIGETLSLLYSGIKEDGTSEIEGYDNTYIKYLLSEQADLEKAMKAMLENNRLSAILDKVFSARVFKNLTQDVFDILDEGVRDLTGTTGLVLATDLTKLDETRENTILTIEGILDVILSEKTLSISDYGKVLNHLKTNAFHGGEKDGVFNNIFINVIWYLTGDDLTSEKVFASFTSHEKSSEIKSFLNISDYYAENVDYERLLADAQNAIEFAKKLKDNVSFDVTPDNSITNIVAGIETSLEGMTEEEKVSTIENLNHLLTNQNEDLLENFTQESKAELDLAIQEQFGSDSAVSQALKDLLNI